jgi:queuine tRNA-ribosyltransferase
MDFKLSGTDGNARAGVIMTSHGIIETPAFMPCGTTGAVKAVRWSELEELDYRLVLVNALHLYLRPGAATVGHLGGVQAFTGWPGAILADSGGYQFFSLKGLYTIDDDGVGFQSPYDGSAHRFTPESLVDIQVALGSDIIMPLDECAAGDAPRVKVIEAGERTLSWILRAAGHFKKVGNGNQALFGIVQGGVHLDLRRSCAERTFELDLPGYALGGISVGEDRGESEEVVERIAPTFPPHKPRYLMGVGLPAQVLHGIANGIDMFDCVLPTRMGRNGTVFTSTGRLNMGNSQFRIDPKPLDPQCSCPTCRRYSRAYLAHLHRIGDPGVLGLLSLHNLAYYRRLVRDARSAVEGGRFSAWRSDVEAVWDEER